MAIVLAFDASWGCLGWALCTANKPVRTGYAILKSRSWRMAALREVLAELEHHVADLSAHLRPGDSPPRVVIERAPKVYAGRGNQAAIGFGLGQIAGALELWGCRPAWSYPWLVGTDQWRRWWWHKLPRGRVACKTAAVREVERGPWRHHLDGLDRHRDREGDYEGPAVDVAEAILLGMGAARRDGSQLATPGEAPRGPVAWERARADGTAYLQEPRQPQLLPNTPPRRSP